MTKCARLLHLWMLTLASCAGADLVSADRDYGPLVPLRLDCRLEESIPLDFNAFVSAPDRYLGRCVRAHGIIAFRRFYPDPASLYSFTGFREQVGVYGKDSDKGDSLWVVRKPVDLVGYTYTCEEYYRHVEENIERETQAAKARGEDYAAIPFVAGECHYHGGPTLFVSQWKALQGAPSRLMGRRAAEKYGDIFEMNRRWRYAAEVDHVVREWFRLMSAQDVEGLHRFLLRQRPSYDRLSNEGLMRDYVQSAESPYARLFGKAEPMEMKLLQYGGTLYESQPGDYQAFGCVCMSADCEGQWPIHSQDTEPDNPDWPYLCVRVVRTEDDLIVGPF